MSDLYIDDEGNEMQPLICEDCKSIFGWSNKEIDEPTWCEHCLELESRDES